MAALIVISGNPSVPLHEGHFPFWFSLEEGQFSFGPSLLTNLPFLFARDYYEPHIMGAFKEIICFEPFS